MKKYAFYSPSITTLSPKDMKRLAKEGEPNARFDRRTIDAAAQQFIYIWPDDLQIVINRMPGHLILSHLAQLFQHTSQQMDAAAAVELAQQLFRTSCVIAMVVKGDENDNRVQHFIKRLCAMSEPLIYANEQFDWRHVPNHTLTD